MNNLNVQPDPKQNPNKINMPPNNTISSLAPNNMQNLDNFNINNSTKLENTQNNTILENIQNNNNVNYVKNLKKIVCTCTKTQCQKKYCACFASGIPCQGCDCKDCLNIPRESKVIMHEGDKIYNNSKEKDLNIQSNIIPDNKGQAIVCNCTKSKCMKKYCECYKMGFDCGNLCRCIDCQNKNNKNFYSNINPMKNYIENENVINDMQKNMQNDYIEKLKEICKSLSINAMGIHIHNKKMIIEEREIDLNRSKINLNTTPKLNKKRARGKNENYNLKTCPTTGNSSRRKKRGYSQINSNVKVKKISNELK